MEHRSVSKQRIIIAPNDRGWLTQVGLASVREVSRYKPSDVVALSRSSDIFMVLVDPTLGGPSCIFVKRYHFERASQRVKQIFRGTLLGKSRARFEYEFLNEMIRRGLPTVRPVAYGEKRKRGFVRMAFLITVGEQEVGSLDHMALSLRQDTGRTEKRNPFPADLRRSLTDSLGRAIRRMHDAGVRHGGLFWRNILVRERFSGDDRILFLDPDTRGKLVPGSLSQQDAIADLSQVIASGMALGMRSGLLRLLKAYLGVARLSAGHRSMVARLLPMAHKSAKAELHRLAVSEVISQLRGRVVKTTLEGGRAPAKTIEEFFDSLARVDTSDNGITGPRRTVHFMFDGAGQVSRVLRRTAVIDKGRIAVLEELQGKADLTIQSDEDTWLSILSGREDAFALIRSGRVRVHGDTTLLVYLAKQIGL